MKVRAGLMIAAAVVAGVPLVHVRTWQGEPAGDHEGIHMKHPSGKTLVGSKCKAWSFVNRIDKGRTGREASRKRHHNKERDDELLFVPFPFKP